MLKTSPFIFFFYSSSIVVSVWILFLYSVFITEHLCFRYSMLVEDGVVKKINVEPDGTGLTCSLASSILSDL